VTSNVLRVMRHGHFRWFLASWATASTGYSLFAISVVWIALQTSHSLFIVGAVLAVERAAYAGTFLLAPLADRVRNQRTIYLASYPVQAAAAGFLGYGALRGTLSVAELLALVAVLSVLWDLSWAAANAAPGILLTPDDQFAVGGVEGLLGGVNSIAGFAVGGVLLLVVGAGGGMLLYAALLVVATLLSVPLRIVPPPTGSAPFLARFREGWRTVFGGRGRPLLQLGTVDAVQGFFSAAPIVLLALIALRTFGGGASAYAVLFVAYVVGGVVAGLGFARWNPRRRVGLLVVGSLLLGGATLALVAGEPRTLVLAAAVWFLVGFAQSAYQDAKYAFLRGSVEASQLARVVSNLYLFPGVTSAVGIAVIGAVAVGASPSALALLVAVGLAGAGLLAAALPGVRALRY